MSDLSKRGLGLLVGITGGLAMLLAVFPTSIGRSIPITLGVASLILIALLIFALLQDGLGLARALIVPLVTALGSFALIYFALQYFFQNAGGFFSP